MNFPILSFVTFFPLAVAIVLIFIHRYREKLFRYIAIFVFHNHTWSSMYISMCVSVLVCEVF
ncbi:MAG: hypothetical protein JSV96_09060, partial [Candidatus Aminicenantes bacterium]